MTSLTASKARRELLKIVRDARDAHKVYRIHHRDISAVLMSEEDYDSLMETLELLSIPGFKESIKESIEQMQRGETLSFREVLGPEN
jgi:antitoxin YefM